jgi:hypothetical protein
VRVPFNDEDFKSLIELNDSEILRIENGPYRYMREQQQKRMNLEDFRKTVIEKFQDIGFKADLLVYSTNVPDVYAFEAVVKDRLGGTFDPDRQVHEVVNNLLDLPGADKGWINTDESLRQAEKLAKEHPRHSH